MFEYTVYTLINEKTGYDSLKTPIN